MNRSKQKEQANEKLLKTFEEKLNRMDEIENENLKLEEIKSELKLTCDENEKLKKDLNWLATQAKNSKL